MTEPAKRSLLLLLFAAVLVTAASRADGAGESLVYRWVNAQGEVHFSDTPPPEGIADVRTTPVRPLPARAPVDDFYSVVNQLKRMQERRLAVEQARREARKEDREATHQRQYGWRSWYYGPYGPYTAYSDYGDYYSGSRYPYRRWHSLGPRPGRLPSHPTFGRSRPRHSVGPRKAHAVPHHRLR